MNQPKLILVEKLATTCRHYNEKDLFENYIMVEDGNEYYAFTQDQFDELKLAGYDDHSTFALEIAQFKIHDSDVDGEDACTECDNYKQSGSFHDHENQNPNQ